MTDGNESVTIPVVEHERLLAADRKLEALENAGVDNWDGYDYAMDELRD